MLIGKGDEVWDWRWWRSFWENLGRFDCRLPLEDWGVGWIVNWWVWMLIVVY